MAESSRVSKSLDKRFNEQLTDMNKEHFHESIFTFHRYPDFFHFIPQLVRSPSTGPAAEHQNEIVRSLHDRSFTLKPAVWQLTGHEAVVRTSRPVPGPGQSSGAGSDPSTELKSCNLQF